MIEKFLDFFQERWGWFVFILIVVGGMYSQDMMAASNTGDITRIFILAVAIGLQLIALYIVGIIWPDEQPFLSIAHFVILGGGIILKNPNAAILLTIVCNVAIIVLLVGLVVGVAYLNDEADFSE